MPNFQAIPLDMISAPNYYAVAKNNRWEIISPNATTLWFDLSIIDSLGQRPYSVGNSAVLQVIFMRADKQTIVQYNTLTATPQTVTKTASVNSSNKSLFSVSMSSQDIQIVVSGTVKFTLVDGSVNETWNQNWMLQKTLTSPGF